MSNILRKWFYPKINKESLITVKKVLKSGFINEGKISRVLSDKIAKICRRNYASTVSSGSTGLVAALLALGIKKNDLVLIPGFSFIATANAVSLIGAKIHFVDINPKTYCMCDVELEKEIKKLTKLNKKISSVITVEVNGRSPEYKKIEKILKVYKIPLITDSAEALGSNYNGRPLGSFGSISVISMSPNKIITSAQGGIVLTDSKKLFNLLEASKKQGNHIRGDGGSDKYYMKGLNFKLSDIHSAIAIGQLTLINKRLKNLEKINSIYKKNLPKNLFKFDKIQSGGKRLWVDCITGNKKKAISYLKEKQISYREFWIPMNLQKSYNMSNFNLPNTYLISRKGIWLASNFDITPKILKKIF